LIRLLAYVLGAIGLLLLVVWVAQRRLIYFPFGNVPAPADVGLPRAETISFQTPDGLTLHGWWVPAGASSSRATVILFNGNAGNRAYRAELASELSRLGFATLLFDYRGYGDNPGSPSEQGLTLDAQAARRYVESRPGVDRNRIIYFGESLGTGVAVRLASEQKPRALILRSPFTSLADTARHHYPYLPVTILLRDRFPSVDLIPRIGCPLLVIAADHDTIVPTGQSERLFAAASEPKRLVIVPNSDHNDSALLAGPMVISAVDGFLRESDRE
jgi:fermentation-respiration switch protein FrsA (DUF1100 family)